VSFTVNSPSSLPAPWAARDVGGPALAGNAAYSSGTYSVSAAGVDIWGINDQFQFVYQTLDGDGEIVALVRSLQNTRPWTKAGVMIREDLTGGAPNATALVTPGHGMVFQRRVIRGGTSTSTSASGAFFAGVAPYWVRLVRSGNTFTGYNSATGTAWTLMGSVTVPMASHVYVGLAVTSHNASLVTHGTLSDVTVTAGSLPPPPPSLTTVSPTSGPVGTSVTITGANFGGTQGTSALTFNGTTATPTSWSGTSVVALVPSGATTGNVMVTVGGQASNWVSFAVTAPSPPPSLTSVNPTSGVVGSSVTITGTDFGAAQGTSTLWFNSTLAIPISWSRSNVVAPVPSGATTGNVIVTVGGLVSNGVSFTVTPTAVVVTATWDANTEADLAGYVIAYGTQTGVYSTTVDVGNVTTWQVTLTSGVRYYFAIKAYNTGLQFSPYSAEVVLDVP
jgi:hypothetical protein